MYAQVDELGKQILSDIDLLPYKYPVQYPVHTTACYDVDNTPAYTYTHTAAPTAGTTIDGTITLPTNNDNPNPNPDPNKPNPGPGCCCS